MAKWIDGSVRRAATLASNAKMSNGDLNWIANYIWGIADDVLRDL